MGHGVSTLQASTPRQRNVRRDTSAKMTMGAQALSLMTLLYLSSRASAKSGNLCGFDACSRKHIFLQCSQPLSAFGVPPMPFGKIGKYNRQQISSSTTPNDCLLRTLGSSLTVRDTHHTCFHFFKDQTDCIAAKNNPSDYQNCSTNSIAGDNKDALLHRIINGRNSSSFRWRRRTRRAAAVLGIPRNCKDEADYLHKQQERRHLFSPKKADGLNDYILLRPVPPLSSTIFNDKCELPDSNLKRKRLKIEKLSPNLFRPKLSEEQHSRAKLVWAAKYTSIHNLRQSFGSNRNRLWGDFDAKTTRKLYHALLPRALLGLYEVGLWSPEEVAPLAFEARLAAKKYARERCYLPGRLAAMIYDGFRSWKTWGTWSVEGMTWDQIWHKYETQILEEYIEEDQRNAEDIDLKFLQEEITAQICLRILERSCNTNETFDRMLLDDEEDKTRTKRRKRRNAERELARIKIKLDRDIEKLTQLQLLDHTKQTTRRATIFAFSSPFFLDILGGGLNMGSLTLSPQTFVKTQMVHKLENEEKFKIDMSSDINCCTTNIVRALVFPDLCEFTS